MVKYLESASQGEFLTGTQAEVLSDVSHASQAEGYLDPTETLPEPPPLRCTRTKCDGCRKCQNLKTWWNRFSIDVDDIVSKSNIHTCSTNINKNGSQNKAKSYKGCLDNKWDRCKSCFPRETFPETQVDPVTDALNLRKKEQWINNFSPVISYLFRCNTDVTSLRSGTAIKGTLLYVSDYITKTSLKTHVVFESICSVFRKNTEMLSGCESSHVKARKLMTKMVNTMSTKLEMGSPMICLYLLGNPDHYTSHQFVPFYWQSFVREVEKAWDDDLIGERTQKVAIMKHGGRIIGISNVDDYVCQPVNLEDMSLYDWISNYKCVKFPSKAAKELVTSDPSNHNDDVEEAEEADHSQDAAGDQNANDSSDHGTSNSSLLQFTKFHPLAATHGLKSLPSPLVPNFVGQTLPRRDQGDREFYCMTMLTLFKYWRTGSTLKAKEVSWDEAFVAHTFTDQQKRIMGNFNIRYECLDQRDDFLSELKKGATAVPGWINDNSIAHELHQAGLLDRLDDILVDGLPADEIEIDDQQSQRFHQQIKSISITKLIMTCLGWTARQPETLPDNCDSISHESVSGICVGSEWKNIVASKRQHIIESQLQSYQNSRSADAAPTDKCVFQGVKIVDKSYLEKDCIMPE
jgi:hypothetical protein